MSKGSERVTVRVGEKLRAEIVRACEELNSRWDSEGKWTLTEFMLQACVDKLNKIERGRRKKDRFKIAKADDFDPRVWTDTEEKGEVAGA